MPGTERLLLDIEPSRQLILVLLCTHGLALIAVITLYTSAGVSIASVLVFLLITSLVYNMKKIGQVRRVYMAPAGECTIVTADGRTYRASLLDGCYSSDWMTILAFSVTDIKKTFYTVIVSDSLDANVLKKLRSYMKTSLFNADANSGQAF